MVKRTKEFIQVAGLCEPPLVYEIGWILDKDYWGMGIADEVTKELINYARHLGVESCVIECDAEQIGSKKIAIKNGFVYESKAGNLERYRFVLVER